MAHMTDVPDAARSAIDVADWRRRTAALYARVRAERDPAAAHRAWVHARDEMFRSHPASALDADARAGFVGLPVAPYDPAYRFEAVIERADAARIEVETGTDGIVPFERIGVVRLPGIGSLDVWRLASYGGGIFVPMRDGSAGQPGGTYGGGRYVLDTVKGADLGPGAQPGSLVIDLNFAYNPSCAYDPMWACPLAPPGNVVDAVVPVGERSAG